MARSKDERAIRDLFQSWFEAMESGDVEGLLKLVHEDVVYKAPGLPAVIGRSKLREALERFHSEYAEEIEYEMLEVEVSDAWAYARVLERAVIKRQGGTTHASVRGMHMAILRKQKDGTWLVTREIASADHPLS